MRYQYPFRVWAETLAYGVKGSSWSAGFHSGWDVVSKAAGGTGEVLPIAPGVVIRAMKYHASYGNYVTILHDDGFLSLYAHLDSIAVTLGQAVGYDTVLGIEGSTGNVTGRHLHLEVHEGEYVYPSKIDPRKFIEERMEAVSYDYVHLPRIHSVLIDPKQFGVIEWKKGKRTTAIQNYACFPFQATGTVPVGNIVSDGRYLARDPRLSTIWVTKAGKVGVGKEPPGDVRAAVSGIPLIVEGMEYPITAAMAQGWDTSPLYPTTHSILGITGTGQLLYQVFTTTARGIPATWDELMQVARHTGCATVLLGDGGGSTILDIEGRNAVASAGNRQLAALITF